MQTQSFLYRPNHSNITTKKFFLGGAPIVGTPYADLCFIKTFKLII